MAYYDDTLKDGPDEILWSDSPDKKSLYFYYIKSMGMRLIFAILIMLVLFYKDSFILFPYFAGITVICVCIAYPLMVKATSKIKYVLTENHIRIASSIGIFIIPLNEIKSIKIKGLKNPEGKGIGTLIVKAELTRTLRCIPSASSVAAMIENACKERMDILRTQGN